MTARAGIGQFIAWNGGCLFIGHHDRAIGEHAHQAIQLVMACERTHRVRADESQPWHSYSIAAIPTRQPHAIDVTDADYGAVILIEPETREGRAIAQRFLAHGIAEVGDDETGAIVRAIFDRWLDGRRDDTASEARRLVSHLAAGVEPTTVTDPRILSAIAYINERLSNPITLHEVASYACLSPSRFRHLFAEQVGMGLRPYMLWRRFMLTWDLLMRGKSLSDAAHAAGFADSAHLSRTSKRAFGFAPSGIQVSSARPDPGKLLARAITDRAPLR
ncbi:MAG: helix-turn-helix transcriptional regulator [Gemmatimonadaceae bacterium]|nr:helix-turn-helix transcriptional regulator [Gemmatimonadaceae bacterium]